MIEAGRSPQSRRKARFSLVERLLWECDGDYDAVHAAVEEYRKAEAKKARKLEEYKKSLPDLTPGL